MSDKQLMMQVKSGQLDRLGMLFERYHRLLFQFFYRQCRDAPVSEDLVQSVFLRMLKYRHSYRGDGAFKTWMFHIARNVRYDQFQRKPTPDLQNIDDWEDQLPDPHFSPGEAVIRREELAILRRAIQLLPPEHREIIVLSKLQDLPYQAIAEMLGCTVGHVKVKVFRAMRRLKQAYAELDDRD